MPTKRTIFVLAICPLAAWCQKPVVSSLTSAATYGPNSVNSGSIATVFGTNLANCTQEAQVLPLPRLICGTSLSINGIAAPLFYVSPTQINFQWPGALDTTQSSCAPSGIVVCTAAGASDPYQATPSPETFGIFTMDASGCGQGAVLNVAPDGSVSVNSRSNSASPGSYISVFGTGLNYSDVYNAPPDGSPAPFNPLAPLDAGGGELFLDAADCGSCFLQFKGLAPGLVEVAQFNYQLPATLREGCAVPLQTEAESISQPVTISVRQGGGPCVDPPTAGYGQITWQKTVISQEPPATIETDTVSLSLQASPGKQAPPAPAFAEGIGTNVYTWYGPSCPIPGYRSLDAGAVNVQGQQLPRTAAPPTATEQQPVMNGLVGSGATVVLETPGTGVIPPEDGQVSGLSVYQATLPNGTIQPGTFTVNAGGGADVGAFQSSVQIGAGIQVTINPAGSALLGGVPFTIYWTGGDAGEWINVYLISHDESTSALDYAMRWQVLASDGQFTIPQFNALWGNYELVLEVVPGPSTTYPFSAPGLSLGGQATWKYIYRFEGILAQGY